MHLIFSYPQLLPVLKKCPLFDGIPENSYPELLNYLEATVKKYQKGELILRLDDPFLSSGIILTGSIEGSFISENYNKINLNHFQSGQLFGEALACVKEPHSPIQLTALTDCTILFLKLSSMFHSDHPDCAFRQQLSLNLMKRLATQNIFSNLKLRILSQKSLRDRIILYLGSLQPDADGWLHVPFTRTALAEFIGANRSALSRELGRMQDENLLLIDRNKMKII